MIMKRNVPANIFDEMGFGVIGLGDSSYEKYNFTAKKLNKRLIQLGGRPLLDLCLCDEQQKDGIEGTYSKWVNFNWILF
jgi:sulfite reductase alpha subunit-like flavoprotein